MKKTLSYILFPLILLIVLVTSCTNDSEYYQFSDYPGFVFSLDDGVPEGRWPSIYCIDEVSGKVHYSGYGHGGDDWKQGWSLGGGGTEKMRVDHTYTVYILVYESVPIKSDTPLKYSISSGVSPAFGAGYDLGTITFSYAKPLNGIINGANGRVCSLQLQNVKISMYTPTTLSEKDGSFSLAGILDGDYLYSLYDSSNNEFITSGYLSIDSENRDVEIVIPHYHNWDSGEVVKETSCLAAGEKVYHCSGCEETKTEEIPKLAHVLDDGIDAEEATCTKEGVHASTCQVCSTVVTTTIPALGHSWGSGLVSKEATCDEDGIREYTCSRCGETKRESIKKLGHNQKSGWETDTENHWHICSRCGETIKGSLHSHTYYNGQCTGCGRYLLSYDVTFEGNGAEQVIPSQNVREGFTVSEPSSVTKASYHLDGWYSDEVLTELYDFNSPVNGDLKLFAKWTYAEVTPVSGVYYPGYYAAFSWTDPSYEGFDHCIVVPGGFEWSISMGAGNIVEAGKQSYVISGTLTEKYIFVCTVDSKGNMSSGVQVPVVE